MVWFGAWFALLAVLRMSARCVNTPMAQHDSSQTAAHVAALLVVCEEDVDRGVVEEHHVHLSEGGAHVDCEHEGTEHDRVGAGDLQAVERESARARERASERASER